VTISQKEERKAVLKESLNCAGRVSTRYC